MFNEFLGKVPVMNSFTGNWSWNDGIFYHTDDPDRDEVIENIARYAKYISDWNWLMEVVDKIAEEVLSEKLENAEDDPISMFYDIRDTIPERHKCYQACAEFVTWYNSQLTKQPVKEHDIVEALIDINSSIPIGTQGTVVHIHPSKAVEVEFFKNRETVAVITVSLTDLKLIKSYD